MSTMTPPDTFEFLSDDSAPLRISANDPRLQLWSVDPSLIVPEAPAPEPALADASENPPGTAR